MQFSYDIAVLDESIGYVAPPRGEADFVIRLNKLTLEQNHGGFVFPNLCVSNKDDKQSYYIPLK